MADKKISALTASTTPLAGTEVLPIVQSGATVKVAVSNLTSGRTVEASAFNTETAAAQLTMSGNAITASGTDAVVDILLKPQSNGVTSVGIGEAQAGRNVNLKLNGVVNKAQLISFQNSGVNQWLMGAGAASETSAFELFNAVTGDMAISVNKTNANVSLVSNLVIGTSGKGIDFSATAGTGTSELLSDYEEGTWTPVDASGASLTFSSFAGSYIKTGRTVVAAFQVSYPATADVSAAKIGGLPFNAAGITPVGAVSIAFSQFATPYYGATQASAATFTFYTFGGSTITNVSFSNLTMYGVVTYIST